MAIDVRETNYQGTVADYIIMQSMFEMDMVRQGLVNIQAGVKKKHTVQRINVDNVLSPYSPTPVDNGANPFVLDGRTGVTVNINAYREFNPRDLEENFIAPQLPAQLLAAQVPNDLETRMLAAFLGRAKEKFELTMGVGSTAYSVLPTTDSRYQIQWFDGFIKQWINDAAVNRASISQVALTNTNIDEAMDNLIQRVSALKPGLRREIEQGNLKFMVNPQDADLYNQYQTTVTTFKGTDLTSSALPPWKGCPVKACNGIPKDTIVLCKATDMPSSNLYLLMNDESDFQVKIDRVQNNSDLWFMKAEWKMNVLYGWSDEIFMYSTETAADFNA